MNSLYAWSVFLHILAAFVFFFAHGVSMAVAFLLPKERDANNTKLLLDISEITIMPLMVGMVLLLITSLHMGAAAKWWFAGWWWISIVVFFVMIVWMTWYSRKYYSPIRKALGMKYMTGVGTHNPPEESAGMDEVQHLIAKTNPHLLSTVGLLVTPR
jgi:hypothetical protein